MYVFEVHSSDEAYNAINKLIMDLEKLPKGSTYGVTLVNRVPDTSEELWSRKAPWAVEGTVKFWARSNTPKHLERDAMIPLLRSFSSKVKSIAEKHGAVSHREFMSRVKMAEEGKAHV